MKIMYTKQDIMGLFNCSERTFFNVKRAMKVKGRYPKHGSRKKLLYSAWEIEKFLDYFYPPAKSKGR